MIVFIIRRRPTPIPNIEDGLTYFDFAFDLAQRQTVQDLSIFKRLSGSPTGADFLNDLDSMPDLVDEITKFLDPANPDFNTNYQYAVDLDVARDAEKVPEPMTLLLSRPCKIHLTLPDAKSNDNPDAG